MNNRIGVYYGYFVNTPQMEWLEYIKRAAAAGAQNIELSSLALMHSDAKTRKEIAMAVNSFGMELTFATAIIRGRDICSAEKEERESGIEDLTRQLELASEMQGRKIGGILVSCGNYFPEGIAFRRKEILERAKDSLSILSHRAYDHGIVLGLEVVNRFENPLINTVEEGIAFLKDVGTKGIGLHLDTFHMSIEEPDITKAIINGGSYISHIHLAENNRGLPGMGSIDWVRIFKAIAKTGYKGSIVIEAITHPYGSISDRLHIWRNLVREGLDSDLRKSIAFLQEIMQTL